MSSPPRRRLPVPLKSNLIALVAMGLAFALERVFIVDDAHMTQVAFSSGVALAALLVRGPFALPALALSAFGYFAFVHPGPLASGAGMAQAIGALLTLAALAQWGGAAWLARRIPGRLPHGTTRETLRFVLIVALSGAVLSAAGVAAQSLLGSRMLVQGAVLAWLAQVSGMLLVTPLLLWRHPVLRRDPVASLVFPVACVGLGLTLVVCSVIGRTEHRADVERVRANARTVGAGLRHQFDLALRDLQALQALFFKVDIDRADFDAAVSPMLERSPWEVEFAWLPQVARSYRLAFEADAEQPPIMERDPRGDWVPAGQREDYFPATWLRTTWQPSITRPGADAAADSQRGPALRRVRDLGEISMTVPQRHALGGAGQTAVIQLFGPVLATNIVGGATYDPRLLRGVVALTVDLSQMLERACLEAGVRDEALTVFDALDGLAPMIERHRGAPHLVPAADARASIAAPGEVHEWVPVHTAGGELVLLGRPATGNVWPLPSMQQGLVFGIGVVFTALLSGLMALRQRREMEVRVQRDLLEAQVQERTRSLRDEIEVRRRTEGELMVAQEQAEGASRAKSMFLANMSHEIRTPLNAILGYSQLLIEDPALGGEPRDRLRAILAAGGRLLRLINDVLDLSKIEAGSLNLVPAPFDLRREIADAVDLLDGRARAKGLTLTADIQLPAPSLVLGDHGKIGQIIVNILANAVKFTDQGGMTLLAWRDGDNVTVRVSDTGVGISPDELAQLFVPFQQAQSGLDKGGTGLGLALARRIARAMGGDLRLSSRVGEGTVAELQLPLPRDDSLVLPDPLRAAVRALDPAGPACHALVVEDDAPSRDVLVRALRRIGCRVSEAADGALALAAARAERPDIVFTDIRMPVLDGMQLIQALRADAALAGLPVVAVSASSLVHERSAYTAQGFADFVAKPYALDEIYRMLALHAGVRFVHDATPPAASPTAPATSPAGRPPTIETRWCAALAGAAAAGDVAAVRQAMTADLLAALPPAAAQTLAAAFKAYDFGTIERLARQWAEEDSA